MYINLHSHSKYSDGSLDIKSLINVARDKGISYFSITDHDTINGYRDVKSEYLDGINFVSGVEISTKNHDYLHVIGYNIDINKVDFEKKLADFRARRISRVKEIISKLNSMGIEIDYSELEISDLSTVGRPHIADVLVKKGYGTNRADVFCKFLIEGKPAYVEPKGPDVFEAVELIKNNGGFVVLAHPSTIERDFDLEKLIKIGFDGIEAFYPTHTNSKIKRYIEIGKKYNLIITAGTDYHGPNTERELMDLYEYDKNIMKGVERLFNGKRA